MFRNRSASSPARGRREEGARTTPEPAETRLPGTATGGRVLSWSSRVAGLHSFQGHEVPNQIRQFVPAQLVPIRRHGRVMHEVVLPEVRLGERPELLLGIDQQNRERV